MDMWENVIINTLKRQDIHRWNAIGLLDQAWPEDKQFRAITTTITIILI